MCPPPVHHIVAADGHRVPPPYRCFAVRSDEPAHADQARAPYGRVHVVHTAFLDAPTLAGLAAEGRSRVHVASFSDIEHALTTPQELAVAAPAVPDLVDRIAAALQLTGVLGDDPAVYGSGVRTRIDYLVACGAGFHNDVGRHWSRCLFWLLALAAHDVEFVMPHAGVRLALAPGDLVVFDPALAHGLCRPADDGLALAASFEGGDHPHQVFLTGELLLDDAHWAALGVPWEPVEVHATRGALDLSVAPFDDRSGAFQRLGALRDSLARSAEPD
jgi:hypothetical protein